mmetsp:Transcript_19579/g.54565  ORF Transcript_19579/g.54565 Transcript_19579/m.54565 type:complete len:289 (-) Transcript_19579:8-874(-)
MDAAALLGRRPAASMMLEVSMPSSSRMRSICFLAALISLSLEFASRPCFASSPSRPSSIRSSLPSGPRLYRAGGILIVAFLQISRNRSTCLLNLGPPAGSLTAGLALALLTFLGGGRTSWSSSLPDPDPVSSSSSSPLSSSLRPLLLRCALAFFLAGFALGSAFVLGVGLRAWSLVTAKSLYLSFAFLEGNGAPPTPWSLLGCVSGGCCCESSCESLLRPITTSSIKLSTNALNGSSCFASSPRSDSSMRRTAFPFRTSSLLRISFLRLRRASRIPGGGGAVLMLPVS